MTENVTSLQQARELSPQAQAALERAREEGRAEWKPYIANAVGAAVHEAVTPLKDQFDAAVTELRSFHATHIKSVRQGSFWRGFAIGGVVIALVAGLSIWGAWRDAQLVTAAGRAIEQRGGTEIPPLTICDPALETCLPDTLDRDTGYDRPGRAPRSAP